MTRARSFVIASALVFALAPGCSPAAPPPLGEVVIVVDADAPANLVSTLRVDVFSRDGKWIASRSFQALDSAAWPVSFSVYSPKEGQGGDVVARLRAHPAGKVRDYRGERFEPRYVDAPPDAIVESAEPTAGPRLVDEHGVDITPREEPQPFVSIDRLVRVQVPANAQRSTRVTLRGACFRTMANLAAATTCVDREGVLVPVVPAPLEAYPPATRPSELGKFGAPSACASAPRAASTDDEGHPNFDEEACLPGGAFVFGDGANNGLAHLATAPERVVVLSPFRMDKYEFSVARLRSIYAELVRADGDGIQVNEQPTLQQAPIRIPQSCTVPYRIADAATNHLRDAYPVTCVTFPIARLACQLLGGDLPTEAQWEYAAQVAGTPAKRAYAWTPRLVGPPTCDRTLYGRNPADGSCRHLGVGPVALDAEPLAADVTPELGLAGMSGSLSELLRDDALPLTAACHRNSSLFDPLCASESGTWTILRGADWKMDETNLPASIRRQFTRIYVKERPDAKEHPGSSTSVGFRCARPARDAE